MRTHVLAHLADACLLQNLRALIAKERETMADVLAHIAEVDARRLYLPAGHPTMFAYCVSELRLSEDAALKRLQAARTAREFPTIFDALSQGRIHLAGVCMLAPHLTRENVDELVDSAAFKAKSEIAQVLARCFPRTELLPLVGRVSSTTSGTESHAPGHVKFEDVKLAGTIDRPDRWPGGAESFAVSKLEPQSAESYALHVTIVWMRDEGRCTFVSANGHRCGARKFVEYDHVVPVTRGGRATVENIRLRCRGHNQFEAERIFEAGFMEEKRALSRERRFLRPTTGTRTVVGVTHEARA
jgi:hypothetical protein